MKLRAVAVRRWLRRRGTSDRGSSAIELALLAPALLILTMVIIQFALWFQARQTALAVAQDGARTARTTAFNDPGWRERVHSDAQTFYSRLGSGILTNVRATAVGPVQGAGNVPVVGVTVTGQLNSLLNMFGKFDITVTVEGPEECFHPLANAGACT